MARREFLATIAIVGAGLAKATTASVANKRVFLAGFSHETNTFHPVPTTTFRYAQGGEFRLAEWKQSGVGVVPGVSAYPSGGGTIAESACREAMAKVLASLRAAMPVDAVFLRLHGAMYAEGVGPAETELVHEVRRVVGQGVPIACTFDLHGNIPARLAQFGDILVGLKTAPHTDGAQTAELAERILLETLSGKVRPVTYVLPIPMILQGEKAMTTQSHFIPSSRRLAASNGKAFTVIGRESWPPRSLSVAPGRIHRIPGCRS